MKKEPQTAKSNQASRNHSNSSLILFDSLGGPESPNTNPVADKSQEEPVKIPTASLNTDRKEALSFKSMQTPTQTLTPTIIANSAELPNGINAGAIPTVLPAALPSELATTHVKRAVLSQHSNLIEEARQNTLNAKHMLQEAKATQTVLMNTVEFQGDYQRNIKQSIEALERRLRDYERLTTASEQQRKQIEAIKAQLLASKSQPVTDESEEKATNQATAQAQYAALSRLQSEIQANNQGLAEQRQQCEQATLRAEQEIAQCAQIRKQLESAILASPISPADAQVEPNQALSPEFKTTVEIAIAKVAELTEQAEQFANTARNGLKIASDCQNSLNILYPVIETIQSTLTTNEQEHQLFRSDLIQLQQGVDAQQNSLGSMQTTIATLELGLQNFAAEHANEEQDCIRAQQTQAIATMLEEAKSTQKRLSQLLELNNTVSERINQADQQLEQTAKQQSSTNDKQAQTMQTQQSQQTQYQQLLDQIHAGQTDLAQQFTQTQQLVTQIEQLCDTDGKHRHAILTALKDTRQHKRSLARTQMELEQRQQAQQQLVEQLKALQDCLLDDRQAANALLMVLREHQEHFAEQGPALTQQQREMHEGLQAIERALTQASNAQDQLHEMQQGVQQFVANQSQQGSQLLKQLQQCLAQAEGNHTQAQSDHKQAQDDHQSVEQLQALVDRQVNQSKDERLTIQATLEQLQTQTLENQQSTKDLRYAATELGYLKQQCEELIQTSWTQTEQFTAQSKTIEGSIVTLERLTLLSETSLSRQGEQELAFDELHKTVNSSLVDLNSRIKQLTDIHAQVQQQLGQLSQTEQRLQNDREQGQVLQSELSQTMQKVHARYTENERKEDQLVQLQQSFDEQLVSQQQLLAEQQGQLSDQAELISTQSVALTRVDSAVNESRASIETIESIRRKAQQSFAHLSQQKDKIDGLIERFTLEHNQQQQQLKTQHQLFADMQDYVIKLEQGSKAVDEFEVWRQTTTSKIQDQLITIDDYQQRAFGAAQRAQAREHQLDQQLAAVNEHLLQVKEQTRLLEQSRQQDAEQRHLLHAQAQTQQQQQTQLMSALEVVQGKQEQLEQLLSSANLNFREHGLATKETQMANRETKLLLGDVRRELSMLHDQASSRVNDRVAEQRLQTLENQIGHERSERAELATRHSDAKVADRVRDQGLDTTDLTQPKGYVPSSFML